ncbi:hypothetical protein BYT27DRAFT_7193487 [Phlegmacium glaucopus]|nr:hypothetical protein BYT27DRAFT_7193487 [Phlegmacium glaucopus]
MNIAFSVREQHKPRSGFSFLPCADGIILHGGYCKQYAKGKRPVGVTLDDTWLLKITLPSAADPSPASKPVSAPQKLHRKRLTSNLKLN